ncbi:hypothetical protein GMPD_32410 [Geomonas paludis]|uniref:Uncharacterized protein n=1 Tax=Geomonas paludis TaxID=2740185 RepID=A0A6V8MYW0_9BACT|nr:hypothetical protein GMPD_32410 [Geomonas paludis]
MVMPCIPVLVLLVALMLQVLAVVGPQKTAVNMPWFAMEVGARWRYGGDTVGAGFFLVPKLQLGNPI